jgi:hypothetical protein
MIIYARDQLPMLMRVQMVDRGVLSLLTFRDRKHVICLLYTLFNMMLRIRLESLTLLSVHDFGELYVVSCRLCPCVSSLYRLTLNSIQQPSAMSNRIPSYSFSQGFYVVSAAAAAVVTLPFIHLKPLLNFLVCCVILSLLPSCRCFLCLLLRLRISNMRYLRAFVFTVLTYCLPYARGLLFVVALAALYNLSCLVSAI